MAGWHRWQRWQRRQRRQRRQRGGGAYGRNFESSPIWGARQKWGGGGYSLTQNITVSLGVQLGGHGGAGGGESYARSSDGITSVGYGGAGGQGGLGELTVGPWKLTVTGFQVRLQLGGYSGSGGNGILTVQPGGTVVLDNGAQLVLGGAAAGYGSGGAGVLNLSGELQFNAASSAPSFTINSNGALNIGNATAGAAKPGEITGTGLTSITNNGVIRFNQSGSTYTFSTAITGSGHLEHNAAGTTTLTGANTYTGGTTINAGTLEAANNQALGTGDVTVGDGAALEVAQTTTLSVGGNLTFDSGSSYRVSASDGGSSSRINVAGTANLAGGVLHVGPTPAGASDFKVGQTYTILTAGTQTGKFDPAKSDFAYLNAALGYKASVAGGANDTVTLTLERNDTAFADLAQTSNQAGVANAVEGMDSSSGVYNYVQHLSADGAADALARLSGDSYANTQAGLRSLSRSASHRGPGRMHNNLVAGYRPGAAIAQSDGTLPASAWPTSKALPAWAEVVGQRQSIDGDGNAAKLTQNVYGLFVGADEEVGGNGWRVGGSLGFTKADAKTKARDASADTKSYSASVYTGKGFSHGMNRVNVMGGLAYTHHRISSDRTVAAQNFKAKYSAHTTQLFGEVGYAMGQYSKQGIEPFAGINVSQQRVGSFQESGGFAALRGESSSNTTTSTTLGVRAHSDIKLAGKDTRLNGTLGWRHAFGDVKQTATMAFEGSSNFTVTGVPLARNTALLGLQAEVELSRSAALELGYQGEYDSGTRDHAVNVKVCWAY